MSEPTRPPRPVPAAPRCSALHPDVAARRAPRTTHIAARRACNAGGAPGLLPDSLGLSAGGEVWLNAASVHCEPSSCYFAIGDLVRIEYDATQGLVSWAKNGEPLPYAQSPVGTPAAPLGTKGLHFGVGQTEGVLEVRAPSARLLPPSPDLAPEPQRGGVGALCTNPPPQPADPHP